MNALYALRADTASAEASSQPALHEQVARAVRRYLSGIEDGEVHDLYDIVLREVEAPLFAEVLRHCGGNQSRTAAALGINRAILRKKRRQYRLA